MPPVLSARARSSFRRGNGCIQCRGHRVKCGKEHPRCSHCSNRDIICHYTPSTLLIWKHSRFTPSPAQQSAMEPLPPISAVKGISSSAPQIISSTDAGKDNLNVPDLELMVQWCTNTYRSISYNSDVEGVWQTAITREAMNHPTLMHGILALSALHLATTTGGGLVERYSKMAKMHQDLALGGFNESFRDINQSNCKAAFALCSLMTICSLAVPLAVDKNDNDTILDDLCEAFMVARNSMNSLANIVSLVENTELRPLLGKDDSGPKMPDTSRLAIMSLAMTNSRLAARDSGHEKQIYDTAITELGGALEKLAQGREATLVAFQWMHYIPLTFLDLVRERRPFALVILAHYAVILHFMRSRWWIGEWGARVIRQIGQHLDAQWQQSISWVVDATGCYIPPT